MLPQVKEVGKMCDVVDILTDSQGVNWFMRKNTSRKYLTGTKHISNNCGVLEVLGKVWYNSKAPFMTVDNTYLVRFYSTGYVTAVGVGSLGAGRVQDHYTKTKFGKGFIGKCHVGNPPKSHAVWDSMMQRCYDPETHIKQHTYEKCSVHPDWCDRRKFIQGIKRIPGYAQWSRGTVRMDLDKDIRIEGNTEYSEDACSFVVHQENALHANKTGFTYKAVRLADKYEELFEHQSLFADKHQLHRQLVNKCIQGVRKSTGGWIFEIVS